MATSTQKPKDPTEVALSAIQDALNIRPVDLDEPPAPPSAEGRVTEFPRSETPAQEIIRQPANDDREQVGDMLQALQRRPARAPYFLAATASLIWAAGGLALAWLFSSDIAALFVTPRVGYAVVAGLAAGILLPIVFFYAIAHLLGRAQDLRRVAESMAQVAIRLAQPETAARDAVVNVGHAIRREVAAMGDGVERALARAAE